MSASVIAFPGCESSAIAAQRIAQRADIFAEQRERFLRVASEEADRVALMPRSERERRARELGIYFDGPDAA